MSRLGLGKLELSPSPIVTKAEVSARSSAMYSGAGPDGSPHLVGQGHAGGHWRTGILADLGDHHGLVEPVKAGQCPKKMWVRN